MLGWGAAMLAAAGLLAPRAPGWATAALAAALAPGLAFLGWAPGLERLYRRPGATETANVEARRPAAGSRRLTLILMAHHDSKSQNLSFPLRIVLSLVALGAAAGLAVLLASAGSALLDRSPDGPDLAATEPAAADRDTPAPGTDPEAFGSGVEATGSAIEVPTVPAALCGLLGALALAVLATLHNGDRSPGGVDNAGSVAILVELARALPPRLPADVELIVLSPGAEEDHMVGAMRWLDRHAAELAAAPVVAINLDGAGNPGRLALLARYGFGRRFAPALETAARRAAARLGYSVRRVLMPPGMGIDAIPFAHRGVPCLTIASGALNRATLSIHTTRDVADNLDPETLERAAHLTAELAVDATRP
jgi:hypothetical protein